ncbi:cell division control protein Cdc6 [Hyaloscypha bicolor E]|uniref:Cell division control protein n=1 Tax=Hyaloscypha bicolor E TaxID=1095630 RepID=A0A2J6SMV9_9HELO|nr:cell division control protein Cdc6 [Hyaloscypha bicolor E]PMD52104.1 cell division control protein Cdc6 [Hyaloscypha bicolor E]
MAPSILGKRTRSGTDFDSKPNFSRVKRPARAEIFNDENSNPFVSRAVHDSKQDDNLMDIDEPSEGVNLRSAPAKHGPAGARVPISPSKFKARNSENGIQNPTPQTPRHRDAFSKPTPITPRHRVTIIGKPLTPRTPRTPVTPGGSITTVYSQARQIFTRSTEPGRLVGREAEREELTQFVQDCIAKTSGGCTYVSGPPGTGKSAMVHEVTEGFETSSTTKKAYINCMSMKTSKDLYGNLLENLCEDVEVLEGDEVETLQGMFVPKKKSKTVYIVTLDEIDHVLSLDLEILYKLFEWSLQKASRLILVGIANALDLTDRFLPRLKARNLKPQLLPFLPYTAAQIKTVIASRLKSLIPVDSPTPDFVPFLHPAAIELCSRKVAGQTGDLRKAFDICRRAIDLIESDTKQKHEQALKDLILQDSPSKRPLEENVNLSSPAGSSPRKVVPTKSLAQSLASLTVETAPRALISHVNKITSATFGNGANQRLKTLNLQQKAALCALVALEKRKREAAANVMATPSKSKNAAPTIKALYDVYCMLCTRDSVLHPLTSTEFRDVVGSLETLSLISAVDGRNGSFVPLGTSIKGRKKFGSGIGIGDEKRVGSCVGEKEVAQAVEGLGGGILKSILSGEGLD